MTYKVKEANAQPGIFWIENEKGETICDLHHVDPLMRSFSYPNAEENAELFCDALNQREEK